VSDDVEWWQSVGFMPRPKPGQKQPLGDYGTLTDGETFVYSQVPETRRSSGQSGEGKDSGE
jgi:hypothetical protein